MNGTKERYEKKPYLTKVFHYTQHHQQSIVLNMLGIETQDVEHARILEIGCSYGGNIISTAVRYPNCEIVGIDLSDYQIQKGNEMIDQIGLKNIKLYSKNVLEYNMEYGKFDYIICHGVYSWVNEEIRNKILYVIKQSLNPNGSAVISYNVYPAWKDFDIIKDIMKFRVKLLRKKGFDLSLEDEVVAGMQILEFLKENIKGNEALKNNIENTLKKEIYYISHEFLENDNNPMYLYQFSKELEKYELAYILDSNIKNSAPFIETQISESIDAESDGNQIVKEQYYDFITNRAFRTSIITHKGKELKKYDIKKSVLDNIYVRTFIEFDKEKQKYILNGGEIPKEYEGILKELSDIYPRNILVKELSEKLGKDIYDEIVFLIRAGAIYLDNRKMDIKITDKNIKLKDELRKYIEVSIKNYDKIKASIDGLINIEWLELNILLAFDGDRTLLDVVDYIKDHVA